jgi:hypothetical protein
MTVQDALIDQKANLTERAKTLLSNAVRQHDTYKSTRGYIVEMGSNSLPYMIPEGVDPLTHLPAIENELKLKDGARTAQRNANAAFARMTRGRM